MIESLRTRVILTLILLTAAFFYILPNFKEVPKNWWFKKEKLNYGLDIQGGAHLVYGVDVKGVLHERAARMARSLDAEMKEKKIPIESVKTSDDREQLIVRYNDAAQKDAILKWLNEWHGTTLQVVESSGNQIHLRFFEARMQEYRQQVIHQAIGVIRNRVDEFGVAEPMIAAQGNDRILVQLPGLKDPAKAKELINRAARLSFHIVVDNFPMDKLAQLIADAEKAGGYVLTKESGLGYPQYIKRLNDDLRTKLPENTMVAFEKAQNAADITVAKIPYLLEKDSDLGGDQLEDAHVMPGEYGQPEVIFRFDPDGRRKFAAITGKNVNRRMAIVLDSVVQSAPVIQGRIDSDTARITLNQQNYEQAMSEANFIATALRAGALPAALEQMEERTVGPTLGQDSIEQGKLAGVVGLAVVLIFVTLYYKFFGLVAGIALVLNLVCMLAILAALNATLTLPGIAGIVLTLGMAIDANVIIFERIKEEFLRGVSLKAAIRDGFDNAFTAIIDANLTNAIAAAVLIYFGTGPVRGFGVTLIVGIVTSMFTAIFVTRVILDVMTNTFKIQKLPI